MVKNQQKKLKTILVIISIIPISILITLLIFVFPISLSFILGKILNSKEFNLLIGLASCIYGNIIFLLLPTIIFLKISKKKNKKTELIKLFTKYKFITISTIIIIIILEISLIIRANTYYKDIKEGPIEIIMKDVIVKRKHTYKSTKLYIIGNLDGKKTELRLTRNARNKINRNKKYNIVKIKYYKNLKEVIDIIPFTSYLNKE